MGCGALYNIAGNVKKSGALSPVLPVFNSMAKRCHGSITVVIVTVRLPNTKRDSSTASSPFTFGLEL
jgi:hypothetical protein